MNPDMNMNILMALALAAQPLPAPGAAPDAAIGWEILGQDGDGRILIDPRSIRRDRDFVHFTIRLEANDPGRQPFASAEMRVVIDCVRRTRGYEAGRSYDRDGRLLQSRETAPADVVMAPFGDDSSNLLFHRRLCPRAGA